MSAARANTLDIRGVMLDPARLTERHEYYLDLLPQLASWGYNTLWWHFCDDEGFALRLQGHPELAGPYALSAAEVRRLLKRARECGIDVVPEVESLGHALAITRLPQYSHLQNGEPWGHNAMCPSHPDTLVLVEEIIDEVAGLFDSPYLHAGLDEADLSGCPACEARNSEPWRVFLDHTLAVHRLVTDRGKRMIMWADAIEDHPELLSRLPKDIVLAHWHYRDVPEARITPSVEAGFDVVGVPAMSGDMIAPNAGNLRNVAEMTEVVSRIDAPRRRGMVVCWWESFRVFRDTAPYALAYTGAAMQQIEVPAEKVFAPAFCEEYFGCADIAGPLLSLHELMPANEIVKAGYPRSPADLFEAIHLAESPDFAGLTETLSEVAGELEALVPRASHHRPELEAYCLAAAAARTAVHNIVDIAEGFAAYRRAVESVIANKPREAVLSDLDRVERAAAAVCVAVTDISRRSDAEWDRTRYSRDRKKHNTSPHMRQRSHRSIVARLYAARRFLEKLSPGIGRAVDAYRRGGGFPFGV